MPLEWHRHDGFWLFFPVLAKLQRRRVTVGKQTFRMVSTALPSTPDVESTRR
jgi:hypothetical protein